MMNKTKSKKSKRPSLTKRGSGSTSSLALGEKDEGKIKKKSSGAEFGSFWEGGDILALTNKDLFSEASAVKASLKVKV